MSLLRVPWSQIESVEMKADYSDVTVVLDRSRSMMACKYDAEKGINSFIEEQKKQAGTCSFTMVHFDDQYDFVWKGVDIQSVGKYTLVPRGSTALLDAIGKAIAETGERLAAMNEADRPSLVVFVIVTDGEENSSKEFNTRQIKEMIEHQQTKYGWQFTFLGANQDAFTQGAAMGIKSSNVASYAVANANMAFVAASSNVTRMRGATARGTKAQNGYTSEEREAMS